MNRLLPVITFMLAAGCGSPAPERSTAPSVPPRFVDLTHELSGDSIFWPTGEIFRLEQASRHDPRVRIAAFQRYWSAGVGAQAAGLE
jgi:hypothetical protein